MTDELWRPYDRMAAEFLAHAEDGAYNAHCDRPAVLELLGDVSGLRVLDAGRGPGLYAEELLARRAEVFGFDASTAMVDLARARVGDRAEVRVARLDALLPYPDDSVDVVLCALAIHYVADRHAAFAEAPGAAARGRRRRLHPAPDDRLAAQGRVVLRPGAGDRRLVLAARRPERGALLAGAAVGPVRGGHGLGFVIQRLVEPRVPEIMRDRWPAEYDKLAQRPGFLALRLLALP